VRPTRRERSDTPPALPDTGATETVLCGATRGVHEWRHSDSGRVMTQDPGTRRHGRCLRPQLAVGLRIRSIPVPQVHIALRGRSPGSGEGLTRDRGPVTVVVPVGLVIRGRFRHNAGRPYGAAGVSCSDAVKYQPHGYHAGEGACFRGRPGFVPAVGSSKPDGYEPGGCGCHGGFTCGVRRALWPNLRRPRPCRTSAGGRRT
jgi:hypothetical protein